MFRDFPAPGWLLCLLITCLPATTAAKCNWSYVWASKVGKYDNATRACAAGLSSIWGPYDRQLTMVERIPGSTSVVFRCHVKIKDCQTCNWTTPTPPWRVDGWDLTAHLVDAQGNTLSNVDVDNEVGACLNPNQTGNYGSGIPSACSAPSNAAFTLIASGGEGQRQNLINAATGNSFYHGGIYRSPSGQINVILSHNSYGGSWLHSYSDRLAILSNSIYYFDPEGRSYGFSLAGASTSGAASGLLTLEGSEYRLVHPKHGDIKFDSRGRAIEIKRKGLEKVSLAYDSASIMNFSGAKIPQRKITISSENGEAITINDDGIGAFSRLTAPSYAASFLYNSSGMPVSLYRKAGETTLPYTSFAYADSRFPNYLTSITDGRGVKYMEWKYDTSGRLISSQSVDGADRLLITYDFDGSSTVVNPLAKKTTYRFSTFNGVKKITSIQGEPSANCPNSNSSFTYDSNGLLKTKTDNKGVLTTFDYNERGLEVSRTEASGTPQARTIITEWHPTLFLPLVVTEPDRVTRYQYDDQGRQLSRAVEDR